MKKLTLILTFLILSLATPAYAERIEDKHSHGSHRSNEAHEHSEQNATAGIVHVSVNGLVCDFCARSLEKMFGKERAVKNINVDLDSKIVTINFNKGQSIDDARIAKLITDAGYNVERIDHVQ